MARLNVDDLNGHADAMFAHLVERARDALERGETVPPGLAVLNEDGDINTISLPLPPLAVLIKNLQGFHAWAVVHVEQIWFSLNPFTQPKNDPARRQAVLVVGVRRGRIKPDRRFMPFIRDGEDIIWTSENELGGDTGGDLLEALRDGVAGRGPALA
jgi:hypothetical protein